jgi:hypothetical protein
MVSRNETIKEAVLARLTDTEPGVRLAAVRAALKSLEEEKLPARTIESEVLPYLCLDADESEYVRGASHSEVMEIQERVASFFGPRLSMNAELLEWVLSKLEDARWSARLGAIMALVKWPGGPPKELVPRILESLEDTRGLESYPARLTAASYLINRDPYSKDAVEVCMNALDYGVEPWEILPKSREVRKQAAMILGKLEPLFFDQRVYDKLRAIMHGDEDADVHDAAYSALVRLAAVAPSSATQPN